MGRKSKLKTIGQQVLWLPKNHQSQLPLFLRIVLNSLDLEVQRQEGDEAICALAQSWLPNLIHWTRLTLLQEQLAHGHRSVRMAAQYAKGLDAPFAEVGRGPQEAGIVTEALPPFAAVLTN